MDPFDHCEALVRDADKDRFVATLFAPAKCRRPLFALYAFNMEVTRIREAAREALPGELRLQWWRDVFAGPGRSEARGHPVAAALLDVVVRYRLPPQTFAELIDAHAFDLYDEPMRTVAELEHYASRTSAALMRLAALILKEGHDADVDRLIECLGIAQAITAVLMALPLHASRRQLYLPAALLTESGATVEDVFAGKATTGMREAISALRRIAWSQLSEAKSRAEEAPGAIAPALLPAVLIRPILDRMERRRYDPFRPPVLPQWRRQWIIWRAARKGWPRVL
jgi:phytoene synthase